MQTFSITSFGCKVNQYESQQLRSLLESLGLTSVSLSQKPELVIVHTCCVTHTASSKSRQGVRKALKITPNAQIVVSGCLPSAPEDEVKALKELGPNVHLFGRNSNLKNQLTLLVGCEIHIRTVDDDKIKDKTHLKAMDYLEPITAFKGQSRAFLKVQDGCDGYCSYCIIPKIRTDVCSRDIKTVLAEAKNLVKAGHSEIVLTGIFLGAYGQNTVRRKKWPNQRNPYLAELVEKIAQTPNLKRLRLSSLEPGDVSDQLLAVFCRYPNIAPHLHLPLQSGSDNILRKMGRQYRINDFKAVIEKVKSTLDRPAITTDIIVGFPGETDEDFAKTVEIAEFVGFSKMHIFSFSPRKGTAAANMKPFVKPEIVKQRSQILHKLNDKLAENFRQQFIGEDIKVIIENTCIPSGRCERYFELKIANAPKNLKKGQLITAKLN